MFEHLRYAHLLDAQTVLKKRWAYVVFAAVALILLGFLYGWSILAVPLQEDFGWSTSQLAVTFTISSALFCIGGVIGAQITKRTAPRFTLWLAAFFVASGYMASTLAEAHTIQIIYVAYGVFVGGATGMAHNAVLGCINTWFPDRVGVSSGLLTLGFGVGSLVIGPAMGAGIEVWGWQAAFIVLGLATALVLVLGSVVVRYPHPQQILPQAKEKKAHTATQHDFTTRQMLSSAPFYLIFIAATLMASVYLGTMGNAKLIALEMGAAASLATVMVGFVSAGDGVSRPLSGVFFDRFGYRASIISVASVFTASALTLYAAYASASLLLVGVGFVLLGIGFGSLSTVYAALTYRFFGKKNYGSNLSVAYLDFVPASLIGPSVLGVIQTSTGSFQSGFLILIVLGALAIVLTCFVFAPQKLPHTKDPCQ